MSTGVTVSDEATAVFNEFKKQSNPSQYLIFMIQDKKTIVVEDLAPGKTEFTDLLTKITEDECRYIMYKMDYTTNDGRENTKLVSISWSPDSANVKNKMLYAGSKAALDKVCVGISVKVTATDRSELTKEIVQDACKKF